ncbi:MAG: YihY/virulence factor BrkB family protein [Candidatus Acidiferrales bacterium]
MPDVARKLRGSLGRVFTGCVMQAQAVAFNMFLAFFPMLLLALGLMGLSKSIHSEIKEFPNRLRLILPPGSETVVYEFLSRQGGHTLSWISLGIGGSLLAGTQVLSGFMDGFMTIVGDRERPTFFARQIRSFILLAFTIAPWVGAVVLTVFGKQIREWIIHRWGLPQVVRGLWVVVYLACVLVLAMGVLSVLYRFGRPRRRAGSSVLPGAVVATILWWLVGASFGLYVRHVPYGVVYGGLAAAIGLLLWMYMTAIVVFLGAAYNVETDVGLRRR